MGENPTHYNPQACLLPTGIIVNNFMISLFFWCWVCFHQLLQILQSHDFTTIKFTVSYLYPKHSLSLLVCEEDTSEVSKAGAQQVERFDSALLSKI